MLLNSWFIKLNLFKIYFLKGNKEILKIQKTQILFLPHSKILIIYSFLLKLIIFQSAIAARFDLMEDEKMRKLSGAIDAKITNFEMIKQNKCDAISGPSHQNQTPFDWSKVQI